MSLLAYSVGLVVIGFLVNHITSNIRFYRKYKFPNFVPGWPIIGSIFNQPYPAGMWGVRMAKQYGNMFTQKLGSRHLVYLNRTEDVENLMDKRQTVNSRVDRPNLNGIMSGNARTVFMAYNDRWRKQRKILHGLLNSVQAGDKFTPFQNLEAKQLVYELLKQPEEFNRASQRFANSVIISVLFGRRARIDDQLLEYMSSYVGVLGEYQFNPLANPADFLYFLWYLPKPLQWWRPFGEKFHQKHLTMFKKEVAAVEEKMDNGTARPCFAVDFLQGSAIEALTEVERIYTFSGLIEAGSDTTRTSIMQLIAAMACYPAWAAKARRMIDEVCGAHAERLPVLHDRPQLPYLTAVVKETLRWRPFLQTGVSHTCTEDIEYKGYRFPAGTDFTWNAYAIALNESEYKDPNRFDPDRFMNADLDKWTKGHWAFGTGRRVCAGMNVAFTNLWIASAVILYCFDVAEDQEHPIDQFNTLWESPEQFPFIVKITPRSQAHVDLIERSMQEVRSANY